MCIVEVREVFIRNKRQIHIIMPKITSFCPRCCFSNCCSCPSNIFHVITEECCLIKELFPNIFILRPRNNDIIKTITAGQGRTQKILERGLQGEGVNFGFLCNNSYQIMSKVWRGGWTLEPPPPLYTSTAGPPPTHKPRKKTTTTK